jgi:hypothetical protein
VIPQSVVDCYCRRAIAGLDPLLSISAAQVADEVLSHWLPRADREVVTWRAYVMLGLRSDRLPRLRRPRGKPFRGTEPSSSGAWLRSRRQQ